MCAKKLTHEARTLCILEAASALFAKFGFRGTTTKSIADNCKVNEALIFKHFPSKNALYDALLQYKISEHSDKLADLENKIKKSKSKLLSSQLYMVAQFIVDEHRKDDSCLRTMTFSALEDNSLARKFFEDQSPEIVIFVQNLLNQHRDKKDRSIDTDLLARIYLSTVFHYVFITQLFGAKKFYQKPEKQVLKAMINNFINGIAA